MGDGQNGGGTPPIDVDDWTQDFLNEAIQLELSVISSRNFPSLNRSSQPAVPSSSRPPPPPAAPALAEWEAFPPFPSHGLASVGAGGAPSFSPPRELSQRFHERPQSQASEVVEIRDPWGSRNGGSGAPGAAARKEKEVDRLKRELGRVSKQLNHMEHECLELKKERARKDEQLKFAFSQIETKDAEIHSLKREKLEAPTDDYLCSKLQFQNTSTITEHPNHCHISEDASALNIPRNLERSTERYDGKITNATLQSPGDLSLDKLYHVPKRKDVRSDGTCAVSELKRRITADNNLTTATGGSFLESPSYAVSAQIKCNKTIGVQTDIAQDDCPTALTDDLFTEHNISRKLLAIWSSSLCGSLHYKTTGRELISNLFVTCSAELCVLFRCMNMPSKTDPGPHADRSFSQTDKFPNTVLPDGTHSVDAAKVSRFHDILLKVHNEMAQLDTLFEALLDLCMIENVSIGLKSLHILHAILWQLFSNEIISTKRNNVLVDSSLRNTCDKQSTGMQTLFMNVHGYDGEYNETETETSSLFQLNIKSIALQNVRKDDDGCCSRSTCISFARLVSLFETMRQISLQRSDEYILTKAVSIMNLILMRSNPNLEREKFGLMPLLRTVSQLLQKQIGLDVQRQVLRLFFLLLNCPKALMMFCTGGKNGNTETDIADALMDASALQKEISHILNGLSELLARRGADAQELKLRRQVIIILAYIATYGQPGFEILLNTVTPQGVGFLESIVRLLMSELDAEVSDSAEAHSLCKERFSLMREALILLNRLASHPAYSKSTLGALTNTNAMASLTVDVANRIPQRSRYSWKQEGRKKTQIEVEAAGLARLFRTRVFAYLGENAP